MHGEKWFSKMKRAFALILSVIILSGIMPVLPSDSVFAAGLVTLSKSEGSVGTQVEVNGSGYVSDLVVKVYFSSDDAAVGREIDTQVKSYELVGEVKINSQAMFLSPLYFNVPSRIDDGSVDKNVGCGDYYIYIVFSGSKRIEAKAKFFVLGPIILNPSTGKIGDWASVSGSGLKSNTMMHMYFSSDRALAGATIGNQVRAYENVGLIAVGSNGFLQTGIAFKIPERLTDGQYTEYVHSGDYYLYLTYVTSATKIETITRFVVVGADIKIEPLEGTVGSKITISGQGMRPDQPITITYDDDIINTGDDNIKTDKNGNITCSITIPASTIGSHAIQVADVTGNKPEAWFTVKPKITLPDSVNAKATISISGDGFSEVQDVTITINDQYMMSVPTDVTTNRQGYFNTKIQAPSLAGMYIVKATDKLGVKAESQITILAEPETNAAITLYPSTSSANPGYVGELLTVTGSKFTPNTNVTVSYGDGYSVNIPVTGTDLKGSFDVSFIIPEGKSGSIIVTATDNTKIASATFILESESPPPPVPIIPEVASGVKPTTIFDWTDITDKSGVTYTLQVATDTNFVVEVLDKTGLIQSEYTLASQEQLELKNRQSEYYWRVKAVDGAGNESGWTIPVLFYVGSAQLGIPWWYIPIFVGLGILLIVAISIWLRRVMKNRIRNS